MAEKYQKSWKLGKNVKKAQKTDKASLITVKSGKIASIFGKKAIFGGFWVQKWGFWPPKRPKMGSRTPKIGQNGQKWPKNPKNDQKWPKMTKNGPKVDFFDFFSVSPHARPPKPPKMTIFPLYKMTQKTPKMPKNDPLARYINRLFWWCFTTRLKNDQKSQKFIKLKMFQKFYKNFIQNSTEINEQ